MLETYGEDIFDKIPEADCICITTNCSIDDNGCNPMGGGLAGAAARRWNKLPSIYGKMLSVVPNVPCVIGWVPKKTPTLLLNMFEPAHRYADDPCTAIVAYPTMVSIGEPASLELVMRSAELLVEMADLFSWQEIYLGSPGTGIGGLEVSVVHNNLETIFDNRFTVMRT